MRDTCAFVVCRSPDAPPSVSFFLINSSYFSSSPLSFSFIFFSPPHFFNCSSLTEHVQLSTSPFPPWIFLIFILTFFPHLHHPIFDRLSSTISDATNCANVHCCRFFFYLLSNILRTYASMWKKDRFWSSFTRNLDKFNLFK